jgi:3-oxoacyl-(acyl-carrier-protein) synthase
MAAPTLFEPAGGGPVAEVDSAWIPALPEEYARLDSRGCRLMLAAADEAIAGARLEDDDLAGAAIFTGTTSSGILEGEEAFAGVGPDDPRPEYRFFDDQYVAGALGRALARIRHVGGPRVTISTACSSSANALVQACAAVEQGRLGVALVQGVDSLTRLTYHGFGSLALVSPSPCVPFDAKREGLTLGEGAACLVVEHPDRARARGAPVHCAVAGWSRNVDGHHITQPDPEGRGIEACVRASLAHARVEPGQVGHVNAHGTGTLQNDLVEGSVMARVFGRTVPVTSTKSYTGHTLGAAGALETLLCALGLGEGFVPATLGTREVDPALEVDVVTGTTRSVEAAAALTNSFGFGGNNCCVVLGRTEGEAP